MGISIQNIHVIIMAIGIFILLFAAGVRLVYEGMIKYHEYKLTNERINPTPEEE